MIRNWRVWTLIALFVGPMLAYVGFGVLWLDEQKGLFGIRHEWLYYATAVWVVAGIAFSLLASRWTKSPRLLLPPIDWNSPRTFSPFDRQAWALVEEEANHGESISMEQLTVFDTYIDTGRRLANRLGAHYHPLSTDPLKDIPVVEVLTALQLAAEDLTELCRQVPGGDLITPSHWKTAVQAAGYLQRANDIYSYLLPIFQPITGLARLGSQKLMVAPAWKNMQQNLLRWFYRAFVNRLGTHLIELNSGRLVIGATQYRRLSRKAHEKVPGSVEPFALSVMVIGAKDTQRAVLVEALNNAKSGDWTETLRILRETGVDAELAAPFRTAEYSKGDSYSVSETGETSRDRSTRKTALNDAVESDLLIVMVNQSRSGFLPESKFLESWNAWFERTPGREAPPVIVVLDTGNADPSVDGAALASMNGFASVNSASRTAEALRDVLPLSAVPEIVLLNTSKSPPEGLSNRLFPALVRQVHRAERASLLRHMHRMSNRSKARRLVTQVGQQGRSLFETLRHPKGGTPTT